MFIDYENAKKAVKKLYPGLTVKKSATYNSMHIFFLEKPGNPFANIDPICVNGDTGAIGVYIPPDEKTFREVGKLLK